MQWYFFCYHKTGSRLCRAISRGIAARFGWQSDYRAGLATWLDQRKQIVTFAHSLVGFDLSAIPHRSVRLIRDPRDIWVSGYQYHLHCQEAWCINERFDCTPPIRFPRVPISQEARPEEWKREYLAGLNGMSYQKNLLIRDREAGLAFELERYASWTLSAMLAWKPDPDTIDVKIEEFMADFDGTLTLILRHFGMSESDIPAACAAAAGADIGRMMDSQIAANPHIHSRSISRWRDVLTAEQSRTFTERYGEAVRRLGYA